MDADVAIDAVMWKECGLDPWNFVMHPVDAAMTCVTSWQLRQEMVSGTFPRLPDELVHKPWKCPASVLRRAGEEPVYLFFFFF